MSPSEPIKEVVVYTDGGADPNPGPGGYGAVLLHGNRRRELFAGYRRTTNNRMELMGAIAALEAMRTRCRVTIHSDSQYVVKAMTQGWVEKWQAAGWKRKGQGAVPNSDLWKRLLELRGRHEVTFRWVRGHSGVPENERCDELATLARLQPKLLEDDGYESVEPQPARSLGPRVEHVLTILAVPELALAREFYSQAFDWPIRVDVPVYVEFEIAAGRRLGVYQAEAFASNTGEPPAPAPRGITATELYFHCDDLRACIGRMLRAGARKLSGLSVRPWGDEAAYFSDPFGNVLVLARPVKS